MQKSESLGIGVLLAIAICFFSADLYANVTRKQIRTTLVPMKNIRSSQLLASRGGDLQPGVAEYTLVEFGDYECPPCRAQRAGVKELLHRYSDKLQFDFHNLPLSTLHPHAMYAAIVAEAARQQQRFWPVHALLFDLPLSDDCIDQVIRQHLNGGVLPVSLRAQARKQVEADLDLTHRLGVSSTPTFLLCCPNGYVYALPTLDSISDVLQDRVVLAQAPANERSAR